MLQTYHKSAVNFDLHVYTGLVIIPQLRYSSLESFSFFKQHKRTEKGSFRKIDVIFFFVNNEFFFLINTIRQVSNCFTASSTVRTNVSYIFASSAQYKFAPVKFLRLQVISTYNHSGSWPVRSMCISAHKSDSVG